MYYKHTLNHLKSILSSIEIIKENKDKIHDEYIHNLTTSKILDDILNDKDNTYEMIIKLMKKYNLKLNVLSVHLSNLDNILSKLVERKYS